MRIPLAKRLIITFFNILFPPVAVALLTGWTSRDTFINCCLFILAVIPSHIHGFWISMTYFSRKRKVRKGKFPGAEHQFIYSEKVNTGGIGWKEYDKMKKDRKGKWYKRGSKQTSTMESEGRSAGRSLFGKS